jgi:hypothetical protein
LEEAEESFWEYVRQVLDICDDLEKEGKSIITDKDMI